MRIRRARRPVVYLHIGAMKTGTSFLQKLLATNKQNLAEAGYLFPGVSWREQARATRDLLGILGKGDVLRSQVDGMWDKIATEMTEYDGKASILSHEFLSFADRKGAKKAVDSLRNRGAEVHVILVVRDTIRVLPAQWQSDCRSGGVVSWPEFAVSARSLLEKRPRTRGRTGARVFESTQGFPRMLDAWGKALPAGHLHVVTVPPSGADPMLLWQRFASVVGLDPNVCPDPVKPSNTSLGQASADLLRRINVSLRPVTIKEYRPTMKAYLAPRVLAKRASLERRAKLDVETLQFAAAWNRRVHAAVQASSVDLVGDLDDLPTDVPPEALAAATDHLDDPDDDEILAAAVAAWAGLHQLVDKRVQALRELPGGERDLAEAATAPWKTVSADRWTVAPEPVAAAVGELTELVHLAMDLQEKLEAQGVGSR